MLATRKLYVTAVVLAAACVHDARPFLVLEGRPLLVPVPESFEHSPWVYTDAPSLHFHLPEGPDGGTPAHPVLSIEQLGSNRTPESPGAYADEIQAAGARVLIGPDRFRILDQDAIEIAVHHYIIVHFTDGSVGQGETVHHEIIFQYGEHYYLCKLEALPDDHEQWIPALYRFCESMKARS